jgi:amino acid transporter
MPGLLRMKLLLLTAVIVVTIGVFLRLFRKKDLLSYFSGGRWWLTWLSIAVITLMDELTSIFYAPSEAYRFIGTHAIVFIAVTSLLMRFLSTRMVEIAEILEHHNIKGGGVYSFSYLVLGPTFSFIAVSSIMVDYVLTACISTVSAVENGLTFIQLTQVEKIGVQFAVIWGIAGLNILGIKENARFTFGVFFIVALVLLTLLASALFEATTPSWIHIGQSFVTSAQEVGTKGLFGGYWFIIVGIASCILAYSGIESVVQTAGLVKDWRQIGKAYVFLAVTIGIFTPLISALVLGSGINPADHETDLITQFASQLNGVPFGLIVGAIASIALIMAVNTAYVASSELIERVAHRYNFAWIIKTNRQHSLYRIHILSATFFSLIILVTEGSQNILAEMYALGLVASFTINMGSLIIYRYGTGTKEIREYHTSRLGTLMVFVLLFSSFVYLALTKPYGLILWTVATAFFLYVGFRVAKKRAPEIAVVAQTDTPLKMILDVADAPGETIEIYFKRPQEGVDVTQPGIVFVSFYSPRGGVPARAASNHYRFALTGQSLFDSIRALLYVLKYELPDKRVVVHFGWPLSSWLDRLSTGVMVFSIMKLPKDFPDYTFVVEYFAKKTS